VDQQRRLALRVDHETAREHTKDADSWVPGFFTGEGYATIYDVNAQPKLAFYNLLEDLQIAAFGTPRRVRTPGAF
jgi:hypothetical protein